MDVDVCAGGDSTRRKGDPAGEGGAMEVVPLEIYDSARAKIDANLRWLFAKAYGIDHVPQDLRDPFYTDQYDQEHIKPPVIRLLLSGELYCRVCGLVLKGEQAAMLHTHQSVIQALARKGIYVLESDNTPVSNADLSSVPIKMSAHIPLIDALMMAYTVEMISIERVVTSVKRFSTFSASKELPFDLEDAMVFWINKVNTKMREITDKETKMKQHLLESPSHQKSPSKWYWKLVPPDLMHALAHCLLEPVEFSRVVRYRRDHLTGRTLQHFPLLDDLMKDVCDGAALLAVVHFYCPELMRLEDICLKEVPSIADSLYNIQLLREFSNEYLNRAYYLRPEDMLYAPPVLKGNVMVFIAELFWWFETVKPDFVQPRDLQEIKDVRSLLQPKSSRPHIPISNATRRSFLLTPDSPILIPSSSSSPDICNSNNKASPSSSPCHSLLPLRQRQQQMQEDELLGQRTRSNSLTRVDGKPSTQVQGSVLAWPERRQRPLSQPVPYALHFSVEGDGDTASLARSISKDSLVSNILSMTPKHSLGGPHLPPAPSRLNGQGLLMGHVRIEDEEVDVEEEELVAIIHPEDLVRRCAPDTEMEPDDLEVQTVTSRGISKAHSPRLSPNPGQRPVLSPDPQTDSFYLEPLMPAVLKPAKEKSVSLNKEEESGESRSRVAGFRRTTEASVTSRRSLALEPNLNHTFAPIPGAMPGSTPGFAPLRPPTEGAVGPSMGAAAKVATARERSSGFFLHLSEPGDERERGDLTSLPGQVQPSRSPCPAWEVSRDSDSELEDEEEDEEQMELAREVLRSMRGKCLGEGGGEEEEKEEAGEGESYKLREDMKVCERDDKEGGSGRSSPCLSTASWASSASGSASIRMTSFAERKLQKVSFPDGCSSTSSSQKTTPDGSESAPYPLGGSWHLGRLGKEGLASGVGVGVGVVASELVQLHMQLEEQRRAIEHQKKKMETLSARQRLKLGKAAFLNIVKKGKSDTLPQPLKHPQDPQEQGKTQASLDDSCLGALRSQRQGKDQGPEGQQNRDNRTNVGDLEDEIQGPEPDLGDCSRSIEMLNEAISSIQQQMMQMSLQQDLLMKQSLQSPREATTGGAPPGGPPALAPTTPSASNPPPESRVCPAVHFVEIAASNPLPTRRPPKLSSVRGARTKPSTLKLSKENGRAGSKPSTLSTDAEAQVPGWGESKGESFVMYQESPGEEGRARKGESFLMYAEPPRSLERGKLRNTTFRVQAEDKEPSSREGSSSSSQTPNFSNTDLSSTGGSTTHSPCLGEGLEGRGRSDSGGLQEEHVEEMEGFKGKGHLIEVDLSEVKDPSEGGGSDTPDMSADGETKSGLGFFYKDEEKAEDEMAKRRAAFLLKQQRKAEETRLRKLQLEADSELKRDEARRKAEEDRVRKEEEKARRELIKQEYLRRKQQEMLEEQGLVKPRPRAKPRSSRPKSLHRGESCSEAFSKGSTTPTNLSCGLGSTLSLATETESVTSGGAGSQRAGSVGSVESFPMLSRNSSRNMERDWENGSTASSITSTAEYNGPKLFKEPSSKSNKPLITNAIAHCCLAGKVNEGQKNVILEELEKCESNHLMILFRDGGCQFRAIYSFSPETEEIAKFTGTGPRTISRKMIDKLYKYSSDRKQFTVIPAKTVSVSVDALTIHNHLWQVKRSGGSRKK